MLAYCQETTLPCWSLTSYNAVIPKVQPSNCFHAKIHSSVLLVVPHTNGDLESDL